MQASSGKAGGWGQRLLLQRQTWLARQTRHYLRLGSGQGRRVRGWRHAAPPDPGVPQILHFPSLPRRPTQEPSGQSRRWLGSKSSSCFVDMMRELLIELGSTPRHIVAPVRLSTLPQVPGRFGLYGGRYVSETLMPALEEADGCMEHFSATRPSAPSWTGCCRLCRSAHPLTEAARLADHVGQDPGPPPARVSQARGSLPHRLAQLNNCVGQILLASASARSASSAETGAGSARRGHGHGWCALFGCPARSTWAPSTWNANRSTCSHAVARGQGPLVKERHRDLKDAMNEAMRDWVTHVETTH